VIKVIAFFIMLPVVIISTILGIVFMKGKGAGLIAGYNTASPAKQAEYDVKALCKFVGILMFIVAGCFLFAAIGALMENYDILNVGIAVFFASLVTGVIYANTGRRFKKKD
jgi:hypothetical protein